MREKNKAADPSWPEWYPTAYDGMLSNKSSGKGGGRGEVRGYNFWLPKKPPRHAEAMLSRKWLNICLLMESSKWITYFALLAYATLLHLLNCLNLNSWVFSFCSSFLSPILLGGRGMSKWVSIQLLIGYNLWHTNSENTYGERITTLLKLFAPGIIYFRTQSINKLKIIKKMFEQLICNNIL